MTNIRGPLTSIIIISLASYVVYQTAVYFSVLAQPNQPTELIQSQPNVITNNPTSVNLTQDTADWLTYTDESGLVTLSHPPTYTTSPVSTSIGISSVISSWSLLSLSNPLDSINFFLIPSTSSEFSLDQLCNTASHCPQTQYQHLIFTSIELPQMQQSFPGLEVKVGQSQQYTLIVAVQSDSNQASSVPLDSILNTLTLE